MLSESCARDMATVERYADQPARMPSDVRERIETAWGGRPVQLYALADLDASMKLAKTWVALGPEHVAVAAGRDGSGPEVRSFERSRITGVRTQPGLSCTVARILGSPDEPELAVVRYTHRQRKANENIHFVIEQAAEGRHVPTGDADEVYAAALARPVRDAQASAHVKRLAVAWRLIGYLRPYRGRVAAGMAAATAMTLLALVPPYLTGFLIDGILKPFQAGLLVRAAALRLAWLIVGGIAAVYLFRETLAWVRLRVMAVLGEKVARDIRTELYEHLQRLSLSYYSKTKTGSIISRVTSDSDRLWNFIAFGVVELSLASVTLVGLGAVLIYLDTVLGLVMVVPVPFLLWMLARHSRYMEEICLRAWRKWSVLTGLVSDAVGGVRVVKAFSQERREQKRFDERNCDAVREFEKIHTVWTGFWPRFIGVIRGLTVVVWAIALPRVLSGGEGAMSTGAFISFVLYMTMFIHPIDVIGQTTQMINRATSSAHRIFEVLDTTPEVVDVARPVRLEPLNGHVGFENVSFAYDGVRQILRDMSFEVKPGEMIGLVGPSGAGKTTIANLVARFYDATNGRVLVDGNDITTLDTAHYRGQLGMVLQDPYLFYGTILDNVRYGAPDAEIGRVIEAAKAANAHGFISRLPHGYETVVGERGHTLSGGERQRVSIARAILGDPRILILDEATSSVDTETERKIQEALDRLVPGRTVFAIAHRMSTLKKADRLFVIEEGRITERGSHTELLARENGTYRRFYEMQRELHGMYAV